MKNTTILTGCAIVSVDWNGEPVQFMVAEPEHRTHAYLDAFREADADRMECWRMERFVNTCLWLLLWLAATAGLAAVLI